MTKIDFKSQEHIWSNWPDDISNKTRCREIRVLHVFHDSLLIPKAFDSILFLSNFGFWTIVCALWRSIRLWFEISSMNPVDLSMRRNPRANRNLTFGPSTKRQSTKVTRRGRGNWLSQQRQFEIEVGEWLTQDLRLSLRTQRKVFWNQKFNVYRPKF